jgi:large subunit ribosomal protein L35
MPKLKTHRGAKKRFKVTGTGKIMYSKAYKSHILTKKSAKRKRNLGKKAILSKADRSRIKDMLPYDL